MAQKWPDPYEKKTYQGDIDLQKHLAELDAFYREDFSREKTCLRKILKRGSIRCERIVFDLLEKECIFGKLKTIVFNFEIKEDSSKYYFQLKITS